VNIKSFNDFLNEDYFKGLSKSTVARKKAQIKKQSAMSDDDPEAYKEMPGDTKGKKNLKPGEGTKDYRRLYGEEETNEALKVFLNRIAPKMVSAVFGPSSDVKMREELEKVISDAITPVLKRHNVVVEGLDEAEEKKQSTDRSPIDDDAIETGLKNKAKDTGVPIGILRAVMRRGMAAWKTGHRPGAGQQQWGYARVNAFLTKGEGTWGGADKDLAKEVRDGGHDKKLKKG
jgi:hypothetical protein